MFCSLLHLIWIVSCGCPRSLTSKGNRRCTGRRNILAFPFPVETQTIAARCCPSEPLINSSTLLRFQNPLTLIIVYNHYISHNNLISRGSMTLKPMHVLQHSNCHLFQKWSNIPLRCCALLFKIGLVISKSPSPSSERHKFSGRLKILFHLTNVKV